MVCTKCQRLQKPTTLATPSVKRKSDVYYGSPASGSGISNKSKTSSSSSSTVLGNAGVSKSKLLTNKAAGKNLYASAATAYGGSCKKCSAKLESGKVLCHMCAYKNNACAVCGKSEGEQKTLGRAMKSMNGRGKGKKESAPVVLGQKFSAK